MPSEQAFKILNHVHRAFVRATGGRLGWYVPGYRMPVIELTTVGRKSGEPRTTMLTLPRQEGSTMVVVASAGGNDRHPDWYLNILDNPDVTVTTSDQTNRRMRATVASPAERERLWPVIVRDHSNYAGYQRKTEREIPLVLLTPVD